MNRREFIRGAAVGAAGSVLGGCVTSAANSSSLTSHPSSSYDVAVMAMGQAAGTAAALCVKTGKTPRTLDVDNLVVTLKSQKAFLG